MEKISYFIWYLRNYLWPKRKELFWRWVAWRLPKSLVMWSYLRVSAHATTGLYSTTVVPELSMMDALKRWDTA